MGWPSAFGAVMSIALAAAPAPGAARDAARAAAPPEGVRSGAVPSEVVPSGAGADPVSARPPIVVRSRLGGQIFGFDIDPDGNEGILSEAQIQEDGRVIAAVETFNQFTGEIVRVVEHTETQDDFRTLGVVGRHVGLVEYEHEGEDFDIRRTFLVLDPMSAHHFTARWRPPIDDHHFIEAVSRNHGTDTFVAYAYDNSESFEPKVFSSNIATVAFSVPVTMTDASFQTGLVPKLAYNDRTGKALLGIQTIGNPFVPPTFAFVDIGSGATTMFMGVGQGDVNGLAIDPVTNIACATTEIDFSVQFYDLDTLSGSSQPLPRATNQLFSGADVAVDPVHHLFLVAQPISSTSPGTSSIHVYAEDGTLVESLDGFQFSNAGNVVAMHIALHPALRFGYVDGPDAGVREIQAFGY
jgi:hypothetical protein